MFICGGPSFVYDGVSERNPCDLPSVPFHVAQMWIDFSFTANTIL